MNYKKNFSLLSDDDLRILLKDCGGLTLEAQIQLLEVIEERRLPDRDLTTELRKHISSEMSLVDDLSYLGYLGFSAHRFGNRLTIKRSVATRNMDLTGVILGALLGMTSFFAYDGWKQLINEELTAWVLLVTIVFTGLTVLGMLLIIRCLNRLIEYNGFEIVRDGRILNIRKVSFNQTVDLERISLEEDEGRLALVCSFDNSKVELIVTNGGMRARKTLRSLYQKLILV